VRDWRTGASVIARPQSTTLRRHLGWRGRPSPDQSDRIIGEAFGVDADIARFNRIRSLLQAGADPNATDGDATIMWIIGFIESDLELLKLMLDFGGDPTEALWGYMETIDDSNLDQVTYLLAHAAPDLGPRKGETPLHYTAQTVNFRTLDALIQAGADIDAPGLEGKTALHYAAEDGRVVGIRILLAHGTRGNIRDRKGRTPLDVARTQYHAEERSDMVALLWQSV
jgi:ankyrin repeat protein